MLFDLKVLNSVLDQLAEERGIPRDKTIEAIEMSLATAYRKEYGKRGQIIRCTFDTNTGDTQFFQVKVVVDDSRVVMDPENTELSPDDTRVPYNPEQHILLEDAKLMRKDAELDAEIIFPLESKNDFGRIAAQTAKQVIIHRIREAEKTNVLSEFGKKEGDVVSGIVQRVERGMIFVDLGKATGLIPYEEQIHSEHYKPGERIRAYLVNVEDSGRGITLRLSRSHPKFLEALFKVEAPEIANGTVDIKAIAREAGSRSKVAVASKDPHIDPIGSMVGQRGVRVLTVMSELSGEKIDVIEWSEDAAQFIADALSPAEVLRVDLYHDEHKAIVEVNPDQQSLAIGKGGQNVRLAAKLTGWKIDIHAIGGDVASTSEKIPEDTDVQVETEVKE